MRSIVLGAGIAGVTAAYYLAKQGHEVTVLDRQPGPALETSFANGGLVVPSQSDPWASPDAPMKLLKWLGREDAPLLLRLSAVPGMLRWGLAFLAKAGLWAAIVLLLPPGTALLAAPALGLASFAALMAWTIGFARRGAAALAAGNGRLATEGNR